MCPRAVVRGSCFVEGSGGGWKEVVRGGGGRWMQVDPGGGWSAAGSCGEVSLLGAGDGCDERHECVEVVGCGHGIRVAGHLD